MRFKCWEGEQQLSFDFLEEPASKTSNRLPLILQGLAAEARKAGSYQQFEKDFIHQLKHGLYWHWTDNPNFTIDSTKGPKDMSSIGTGTISPGTLMITSDIDAWSHYGNRPYAALIDMTEVPRSAYFQISRGFGNEFIVKDTRNARVIEVLPRKKALSKDRKQRQQLEKTIKSQEDLEKFFKSIK